MLWEARYNAQTYGFSPAPFTGSSITLALMPDGGAVVSGASYNGTNYDALTVRYSPPVNPDGDGDGLLDTWEQMWWGTTGGHAALDDFDHDGIPELLELSFGLNPTQPDAASQPPVIAEGGYLTMTITKHPGATYEIQSAGSLDAAAFTAVDTTVLLDNATTLKVRDNIPLSTPPGRYLRVKVTAAP